MRTIYQEEIKRKKKVGIHEWGQLISENCAIELRSSIGIKHGNII